MLLHIGSLLLRVLRAACRCMLCIACWRTTTRLHCKPPPAPLPSHAAGGVNAAAVAPDGLHIAVACKDGVLRVYALPSGGLVAGFKVRVGCSAGGLGAHSLHVGWCCALYACTSCGVWGDCRVVAAAWLAVKACCYGQSTRFHERPIPHANCCQSPGPCIPLEQSYYGGLHCCAWSPDGRYVAAGGEDDLVAIYGLAGACSEKGPFASRLVGKCSGTGGGNLRPSSCACC